MLPTSAVQDLWPRCRRLPCAEGAGASICAQHHAVPLALSESLHTVMQTAGHTQAKTGASRQPYLSTRPPELRMRLHSAGMDGL